MLCDSTIRTTSAEYFAELSGKIGRDRIPISGSIALTSRCNVRCTHCYLDTSNQAADHKSHELDTTSWLHIIDDIAEAGCLFLLITGGEPLLRKDFPAIYTHAKQAGILVTVFTNGALISPEIIALFRNLPPRMVEVSLYGSTERTYRNITRTKGTYAKVLNGVEQLQKAGIPFELKSILMSHNQHEMSEIRKIAKKFGTKFRFDAAIFPRLDGDLSPISLRVDPETAVQKEFEDIELRTNWREFLKSQPHPTHSDRLFICGSGLSTFHVDPTGRLQPCILADNVTYDLTKGGFREGWNTVIPKIAEFKIDKDQKCAECNNKLLCGYCPAIIQRLPTEDSEASLSYLCEIGYGRKSVFTDNQE
jgi:radical SAM protein with 4Fe4S-binding SPASM domain